MHQDEPGAAFSQAPGSAGARLVAPARKRPTAGLRACRRPIWAVLGLLGVLAAVGAAAVPAPAAAGLPAVASGVTPPVAVVAAPVLLEVLVAGLPEGPYPGRLLGRGLVGDDVREVQTYLNTQGATLKVDGIYGPRTARAVRQFQRRSGIAADGIVGPVTWGRGPATVTAPPPATPPAAPPAPVSPPPPTAPATTAPPTTAAPTTAAPTTAPPTTAAPATTAPPTTAAAATTAAPVTTAAATTTPPAPAEEAQSPIRPEKDRSGAVWIVIAATVALVAALIAVAVLGRRRAPQQPSKARPTPRNTGPAKGPAPGSKGRPRPQGGARPSGSSKRKPRR